MAGDDGDDDSTTARSMGSCRSVTSENNVRFQGYLLKQRKHSGYKTYWVVLTSGHILYYKNEYFLSSYLIIGLVVNEKNYYSICIRVRKDAQNRNEPRHAYCLNNAFVKVNNPL